MNEINFLPQSFLEAQNRRLRLFREIAILVGLVLIGLALFAGHSGQVMSVRNQTASKNDELDAAKLRSKEVVRLQSQQSKLKLQLAVHQGLSMPLNLSSILAVISDVLPLKLALTEISMSAENPKLDLPTYRKSKKSKKSRNKKTAVVRHKVMKIQLVGLSPSDVDVANLVGALAASPIFQNVKMRYAKGTKLNNATAREFRLEMEILMDCVYVDLTPRDLSAEKEVAHVD